MERLKKDPRLDIDSRRSWIVLGSMAWIMLMSTLSVRSAGVIFVGIMEYFGSSREEASWPVSLHDFGIAIGGLPLGFACEYWSCHKIILVCTSAVSAGLMVCYFAPDLAFISVFFGIVSGIGIAGIYVVVGSLCCQHFKKWTATASSITFALQTVNVFFGPPAANYFRTEYGTPEMFLLLGALTLNGLPAALLTKSPPWKTETCVSAAKWSTQTTDVNTTEGTGRALPVVWADHRPLLSLDAAFPRGQAPTLHSPNQQVVLMSHSYQLGSEASVSQGATSYSELAVPHGNEVTLETSSVQSLCTSAELGSTLKVFVSPMFYLDSLSFATQIFTMNAFLQVYVDLAQDRDIEATQAIYLMYVYSIADFVVRIVGGLVVDQGYVGLETIVLLSFIGCALACEAVAWSTSLVHLLLSSFVYGASAAFMMSLTPSLIISDFGGHSVPVVLGGMMFVTGLALLTMPMLVGYFRDNLGKYNGLMHTIAVPNTLFAVAWCWKMSYRRHYITIAA